MIGREEGTRKREMKRGGGERERKSERKKIRGFGGSSTYHERIQELNRHYDGNHHGTRGML